MRAKRILLMHISNISGHRSASLAIEKAIKLQSPDSEILSLNVFNYVHPIGEKVINFFYMLTIKWFPFLWSHLYDNSDWVKRTKKLKKIIHDFNLPKLEALYNDFRPDVFVSTQAFPCGLVADFKRAKGINAALFAVLTDFTPHSYWIYDNVNYYITPSDAIVQKLIEKGVDSTRIRAFGIPFDPKFSHQYSNHDMRTKLDLKTDAFTILIMGGGQGLGPIKKIVKTLDNLEIDLQEIVVCGTNRMIYRWLKRKLKRKACKKDIRLFGYTENIEELMSAADVIITKPGGITCAEALSKRLPMLIVSPIPGQESSNTIYLTKEGAAIEVDKPENLRSVIQDLYNNRGKLEQLSQNALRISKPKAAWNIAELILNT